MCRRHVKETGGKAQTRAKTEDGSNKLSLPDSVDYLAHKALCECRVEGVHPAVCPVAAGASLREVMGANARTKNIPGQT